MSATQSKPLSRRVLVNVKRGPMDTTPATVWQHEIPILEAIHGEGNVTVIENAAAILDEGFVAKKKDVHKHPPSEAMGLGDAFAGDTRVEYGRLEAKYGMHKEIKTSNVEYVYGRFDEGRFAGMVGTPSVEDYGLRQLREILIENFDGDEKADKYPPKAKQPELVKLVKAVPA